MRIVCPSCSAAYDVPDSLVTAGRVVRCARCGGEWSPVEAPAAPHEPEAPPLPRDEPTPPAARGEAGRPLSAPPPPDEPVPPAAEEPVPQLAPAPRQSAMNRLAAQSARQESSRRLVLAWAASVGVLVLAAGAAYAWRSEIVAAWPPSARAYAAFGLHPQAETKR